MMKIEIEVRGAGWKQGYNNHTEVFDEQRLSYIKSMAPTPWKWKTNYSNYTVFDAEGKRIATLPNCEVKNGVGGMYTRDLLTAAPDLLAEVMRLREENEELVKGVEFMTKRFIKSVEHSRRLQNALVTCAQTACDDPFFNEGGEGYEALFGGEEE